MKPDSETLFGGVHNEALCLTLARRCGLNAPVVTTGQAGKRTYLLVTRYDRYQQKDRWRRLHQEDYCQALGKPPSAKYESNQTGIKGPTLADMFALTRNAMSAADTIGLLDYVIFNVLVCNTDAHSKNYFLLITGQGFKLAPLYDVMCAAVWDGTTKYLAQKIADKNRGEHLKHRHWVAMANGCGLNPTRLVARVATLAQKVVAELNPVMADVIAMPAGPHPLLPDVQKAIETRCRAIARGLKDFGDGTVAAKEPSATGHTAPIGTRQPKRSAATNAKLAKGTTKGGVSKRPVAKSTPAGTKTTTKRPSR